MTNKLTDIGFLLPTTYRSHSTKKEQGKLSKPVEFDVPHLDSVQLLKICYLTDRWKQEYSTNADHWISRTLFLITNINSFIWYGEKSGTVKLALVPSKSTSSHICEDGGAPSPH